MVLVNSRLFSSDGSRSARLLNPRVVIAGHQLDKQNPSVAAAEPAAPRDRSGMERPSPLVLWGAVRGGGGAVYRPPDGRTVLSPGWHGVWYAPVCSESSVWRVKVWVWRMSSPAQTCLCIACNRPLALIVLLVSYQLKSTQHRRALIDTIWN